MNESQKVIYTKVKLVNGESFLFLENDYPVIINCMRHTSMVTLVPQVYCDNNGKSFTADKEEITINLSHVLYVRKVFKVY